MLAILSAKMLHTLQMQSLQGRLVQALAEVRQLQLLCSEREQSAHATKLQLDAALSCDAEREEQMASALAAAAVLQEERAALQRAREDAVLQSARAAVAAQAAAPQQRSPALPTHDAGVDAALLKCVACPHQPSCARLTPLPAPSLP